MHHQVAQPNPDDTFATHNLGQNGLIQQFSQCWAWSFFSMKFATKFARYCDAFFWSPRRNSIDPSLTCQYLKTLHAMLPNFHPTEYVHRASPPRQKKDTNKSAIERWRIMVHRDVRWRSRMMAMMAAKLPTNDSTASTASTIARTTAFERETTRACIYLFIMMFIMLCTSSFFGASQWHQWKAYLVCYRTIRRNLDRCYGRCSKKKDADTGDDARDGLLH